MLDRVPAGRINGLHCDEGAIMGPTWTRELAVVTGNDDAGITVGYATPADLTPKDDPQTMTEWVAKRMVEAGERARIAELFGGTP